MGKELKLVGSKYFLIQAFYDFLIISGFFVFILKDGAEANQIDYKIKHVLMKIQKDCNEAKVLAQLD